METSVAKAFAKRLMREISNPDLVNEILPTPKTFKSMSLTKRDRFFTKACSSKKVGVVTKFSLGKKQKRYLCCALLSPVSKNLLNQRDERMLVCQNFVISLAPEHTKTVWEVSYAVSHHAIERYFLRARLATAAPFECFLQDFTDECSVLNTQFGILNTLLFNWTKQNVNIAEQGPKVAYGEQISVFLPTPNGAFLGSFQFPRLNIQTYLAEEDLTDEQKLKKQQLLPLLQAFKNTPLHLPFLGETTGEALVDQHAECAVNLLRVFVGVDGMSLLDAMTNQTTNWEQYQISEAWRHGLGVSYNVRKNDLLSLLNKNRFEDIFRSAQIQGKRQS